VELEVVLLGQICQAWVGARQVMIYQAWEVGEVEGEHSKMLLQAEAVGP